MFEIGQQVVCIKSSVDNDTIKDHVYTISNIDIGGCRCNILCLSFFERPQVYEAVQCSKCGHIEFNTVCFYHSERFVPIDDILNEEIEELVNTELVEA